jgi:hypothetical protein
MDFIKKRKNQKESEKGLEKFENNRELFEDLVKFEYQKIEDLRNRISHTFVPTVFLIFLSLFILLFSKSTLKFDLNINFNFLYSIGLFFLLFYGGYCLILLSYEIHAFMEWRRR